MSDTTAEIVALSMDPKTLAQLIIGLEEDEEHRVEDPGLAGELAA